MKYNVIKLLQATRVATYSEIQIFFKGNYRESRHFPKSGFSFLGLVVSCRDWRVFVVLS